MVVKATIHPPAPPLHLLEDKTAHSSLQGPSLCVSSDKKNKEKPPSVLLHTVSPTLEYLDQKTFRFTSPSVQFKSKKKKSTHPQNIHCSDPSETEDIMVLLVLIKFKLLLFLLCSVKTCPLVS